MVVSGADAIDGVPRDPLFPLLPPGSTGEEVVEWAKNARHNISMMHRQLYDAIRKIRGGEITLTIPTAADTFTPSTDYHLVTKKFFNASSGDTVPVIDSRVGAAKATVLYMKDGQEPGLNLVGNPADQAAAAFASLIFTDDAGVRGGLQVKITDGLNIVAGGLGAKAGTNITVTSGGINGTAGPRTLSDTTPQLVVLGAGSAGTGTDTSRNDHKHEIASGLLDSFYDSSGAADTAVTNHETNYTHSDLHTEVHALLDGDQHLDTSAITGATGDIIMFNSTWLDLPIGSAGDVLTVAAGLPSWAAAAGGGVVSKAIDHTWEGDDANNREIDLSDDYDLIFIWLEESRIPSNDHLDMAYAFRTCYATFLENADTNHYSMASSDTYFQGKMTGADVNKIKLGSLGTSVFGTNDSGMTYRLVGFKFSSME